MHFWRKSSRAVNIGSLLGKYKWAYRVGQADLRDVRTADGLFAVVNGCPPDEGVMVELGLANRLGQADVLVP